MVIKKITGWFVFAIGLIIIAGAINSSYNFFTGKSEFPLVFKSNAATIAQSVDINQQADPQIQMQDIMKQAANQAIYSILPPDAVAKLLNAIVWSMFATFLVYAGAHLASIGIKLIN